MSELAKQKARMALAALMEGDPERAHIEADKVIVRFLREIDADDVADAFEEADARIGFWYA